MKTRVGNDESMFVITERKYSLSVFVWSSNNVSSVWCVVTLSVGGRYNEGKHCGETKNAQEIRKK